MEVAGMGTCNGQVRLGFLVFLLFLVFAIYIGFQLAPPYWEYYSLKEAARQGVVAAAAPPHRDADAKEAVLQKAKLLGVPLTEADLKVFRDKQAVSVEFSWEREVVLPARIQRFSFTVKDSEPIH
ncbi:MAG: DUF4845 domain-containing protein [candidate division NC10 bacterium]|nr:DUF4845 domain-containing protein [candidate division NC10 bacterium]